MISHEQVQAALSARLDGEEAGVDDAVVDAHLAQCPECAAYWERSLALSRSLGSVDNAGAMAPPADLSDAIFAGVESEFQKVASRRLVAMSIGRVILAVLAVVYVVWAGRLVMEAGSVAAMFPDPMMASGSPVLDVNPQMASLYIGAAAVRVGIAAALLFVAWKPGQIPGVLLIVGAMFGFTIGFVVLDAFTGGNATPWMQTLTLLLTCAALVYMWGADRGMKVATALRSLGANPQ